MNPARTPRGLLVVSSSAVVLALALAVTVATPVVAIAADAADAAASRPDVVIADFEGLDYGGWKTTGAAFGNAPAHGTLPGQMSVDGFAGQGLVNSFTGGDASTGTLTSPPFTLERDYLGFLVGGGGWEGKTCVNLEIDGRVVRTATGPNTQSGGSERLEPQQWDVREFAGRSAVLRIVDAATGGWGHINLDQIVQTDRRLPGLLADATRELRAERRYLHLPIKNGGPKRKMIVLVDGQAERAFEIELADHAPDWWAFLDLEAFRGRTLVLKVDKLPEDSAGLRSIKQSDVLENAADLYREPLRPQFHFTSRRGWNNDPNGLVYHAGEYHLFYQHNPYGWNWGNMHWGHAVSRDLIHWTELPIALYPDRHGTMFSGSAVVDTENTAGFRTGSEPPIVCIFTAAGTPFTQGLAYSNDRGRTWTKYSGNPVLPHLAADNRDPKVFWYAPDRRWIMALYLDRSDYALFASPDLKRWEKLCDVSIPGTSECPEFFEIALDGKPQDTRWVFYGGNGGYLIGRFDGRKFTPESGPHTMQHGNAWYATQTYNNLPAGDGRRILLPWGQVTTPGMPFNQMIGLPVELTLRTTETGPRLHAWPIRELADLVTATRTISAPQPLAPGSNPFADFRAELLDASIECTPGQATELRFVVRGVPITYHVQRQELACRDRKVQLPLAQGRLRLRALVDRTSVDIFGNDGRAYMAMGATPAPDQLGVAVEAVGGEATLLSATLHQLKSAWPATP